MVITQGYSGGGNAIVEGYLAGQRVITSNSIKNYVPALTKPVISLSALVSTGSAVVTITCDVADAIIRYTLNGKDSCPNFSSHVYTGPFTIYESAVIHACWYRFDLKSKHAKAVATVVR
jgi:hypothetical protein